MQNCTDFISKIIQGSEEQSCTLGEHCSMLLLLISQEMFNTVIGLQEKRNEYGYQFPDQFGHYNNTLQYIGVQVWGGGGGVEKHAQNL